MRFVIKMRRDSDYFPSMDALDFYFSTVDYTVVSKQQVPSAESCPPTEKQFPGDHNETQIVKPISRHPASIQADEVC